MLPFPISQSTIFRTPFIFHNIVVVSGGLSDLACENSNNSGVIDEKPLRGSVSLFLPQSFVSEIIESRL